MIFAQDYIDSRIESKRRKSRLSWFDRFNLERVDRKLTRAIKRAIRYSDKSTAICAYMTDKQAEYLGERLFGFDYHYYMEKRHNFFKAIFVNWEKNLSDYNRNFVYVGCKWIDKQTSEGISDCIDDGLWFPHSF